MTDTQKWATIIPAYNRPQRLEATLSRLPEPLRQTIVVIDDGSSPPLQSTGVNHVRHKKNLGYGAAQKSGYKIALKKGATHIALIHGDCQYAPEAYVPALSLLERFDLALGSRLVDTNGDGMPHWRKYGNRILTNLANLRFNTQFSDLHTGARLFRASALSRAPLHKFSNDFRFDHQMLVWSIRNRLNIAEFPMPINYEDGVSSISPPRALRYGIGCLWSIICP